MAIKYTKKLKISANPTHLPYFRNFWTILVAERTPTPIRIIKHHRHGGLGNPSLALLIDQLLEIGSQNLPQIGNAQHKADGVKNVGLAGTIKAGDGIEVGIEARDDRASGVGFEALQADVLYVHYWDEIETLRGRAEESGFGDGYPRVREREWGFWRAFEMNVSLFQRREMTGFLFLIKILYKQSITVNTSAGIGQLGERLTLFILLLLYFL